MQEVITSLVTLGTLVGALLGGGLADKFGRTRTLVIAGVLFVRSARWVPRPGRMKVGRRDDARTALVKTQGGPKVEERLDAIADDLTSNPEAGWSKVFAPELRRALWVGVGLAVFQQVTGINAVIYYSDKIFSLAELHHTRAADPCDADRGRARQRLGNANRDSHGSTTSVAGRC